MIFSSRRISRTETPASTAPVAPAPERRGPVELSPLQQAQVAGGSPKGGWAAASELILQSPKGGWA